jgi:hypothetical protein
LINIKDVTLSGGTTFSGNITMTDASGTMILRTASTATFASTSLPTGNVEVTGIVSEFTTSSSTSPVPQINMRNLADVKGGGNTGGDPVKISIADVKAKFTGSTTTAPDGYIQGVVISDLSGKNIQARNLVIQDGGNGIVVRLTANNTFPLGKELKIVTTGVELSEFNKLLQLNNVPAANISEIGQGSLPNPILLTVAELKANFEKYESTLVTIKDVTLSGANTFSGTTKVTDASGVIDMFTRSDASFAGSALPTGVKEITAIASEFTTSTATIPGYQLNIRTTSDIK